MAIDGISGTGSAGATSELAGSRKTIADNFDTFLSILTTQLKNQNPLEPLDTNQFTQQLVQFTSVEQQLKTNEFLEALVLGNQSADSIAITAANQAVNMIGKTVVAGSALTKLQDGHASWTYTLGRAAPDSTITIRDRDGQVVHKSTASLPAGQGTFEWDGKDASGLDYPEGEYSITIEAKDSDGKLVSVLTQTKGVVDSVDLTGDMPVLMVNGSRVYLDSVLSVSATGADADSGDTQGAETEA